MRSEETAIAPPPFAFAPFVISTAYVWPALSGCPVGGRKLTAFGQTYALRPVVYDQL